MSLESNDDRARVSRRYLLKLAGAAPLFVGLASTATVVSGSFSGTANGTTVYVGESDEQFGSDGGHVYAVDAETGDIVWRVKPDANGKQSSPVVVDGVVYIGAEGDGSGDQLYALDAQTGNVEWRWSGGTDGIYRGGVTVADGLVFVGSWDGDTLYALNGDDGTLEWSYDAGEITGYASPNVVDGTLYFASFHGDVHALDVTDGSEEWVFDTGTWETYSQPTVYEGIVYVGANTGGGGLWAIDASDGTEVWSSIGDDAFRSSPTVVDGVVYIGSYDGTLYAVDASTGSIVWEFTDPTDSLLSSPTVENGVVYIGCDDGTLYAVNAVDGTAEWTFSEPTGQIMSSPTVYDGVVYVGSRMTDGGALWAVDAETGEKVWMMDDPTLSLHSSPTVATDPASGDSVDSRVRLGTLGHHHEWAGTDGLVARFEYSPADSSVGDAVSFDGSASSTPSTGITEYSWDFTGDGTEDAAGETVDHVFEAGGEQRVTLTVTDTDDNEASIPRTIDVSLVPIGSFENPPQDLDGDGLYEDVNGDGVADVLDVQALHQHLDDGLVESNPALFDFSDADASEVTQADVEALFDLVTGGDGGA